MPIPIHPAFQIVLEQADANGARWLASTAEFNCASLACCMVCRSLPLVKVRVDNETRPQLWMDRSSIENYVNNSNVLTRVPSICRSALQRVTWSLPVPLLSCVTEIFAGVQCLAVADEYNLEVEREVRIPPGVKVLKIHGVFNRPIWPFSFSAGLQELHFSGNLFNQHLGSVEWPQSLTRLNLGCAFNRSIKNVTFSRSLRCLTFGYRFDQPVTEVSWPAALEELKFGVSFNQPIAGISWPLSLRSLTFGFHFNQPIDRVSWPGLLVELTFGHNFNQSVSSISWPARLETLTFDKKFDQPIDPTTLPSSLKHLTLLRPGPQLPVLPGVTVSGVPS